MDRFKFACIYCGFVIGFAATLFLVPYSALVGIFIFSNMFALMYLPIDIYLCKTGVYDNV